MYIYPYIFLTTQKRLDIFICWHFELLEFIGSFALGVQILLFATYKLMLKFEIQSPNVWMPQVKMMSQAENVK